MADLTAASPAGATVEDLHPEVEGVCDLCEYQYPCATVRAARGQP